MFRELIKSKFRDKYFRSVILMVDNSRPHEPTHKSSSTEIEILLKNLPVILCHKIKDFTKNKIKLKIKESIVLLRNFGMFLF